MAVKAKTAADAPKSELVVTKITPKGINAVIKNVVLNWVFLAKPAQDKKDPKKAAYRTQMALRGGEKEFVKDMETALKTYLKNAAVSWGQDVRIKKLQIALTLDIDKSLFKTTDIGLTLQTHQTVFRDSEADDFIAKYPPKLVLSDGSECPAHFIEKEFYSGVVADVAVFISTYENPESSGITMYLNGVRKVANGERIASSDPFADVPATVLLESDSKSKGLLL